MLKNYRNKIRKISFNKYGLKYFQRHKHFFISINANNSFVLKINVQKTTDYFVPFFNFNYKIDTNKCKLYK